MPFIEGVALGVVKRALNNAIKAVASDLAKKGTEKAVLNQFDKLSKTILSDTDALFLNRMKKNPDKIIFNYLEKSMGIPTSDLKKILKAFKQTPQTTAISKSKHYKEAVKNRALKELKLDKVKRIKDIPRIVSDLENDDDEEDYNLRVKNKLKSIQNAFTNKINEADFRNKRKQPIVFDTELMYLFDEMKKYTEFNCRALDDVEKLMDFDLLAYIEGSDDLLLSYRAETGKNGEDIGGWERYSLQGMNDYISTFKEIVQFALM